MRLSTRLEAEFSLINCISHSLVLLALVLKNLLDKRTNTLQLYCKSDSLICKANFSVLRSIGFEEIVHVRCQGNKLNAN